MALVFLSDGKPSDKALSRRGSIEEFDQMISNRVGTLAKQFGRRLNFTAIGIGDSDDFGTLERMVEAATDYGATASFKLPSMTSSSLGDVFTSVATSLTTTQSEMTDVFTSKQLKIRNVERESRKKASQQIKFVTPSNFWLYRRERVRRTVYRERLENGKYKGKFEEAPLQHPHAGFVAMCKETFGEGGERFAYRFYELACDSYTIVGAPMVAKESRLVLDEGAYDERARRKSVQKFCATQQLAGRLAQEFNDMLTSLDIIDKSTHRTAFLDCSVYQLTDKKYGELSVLVEEKLDHNKWFKWNANNGYVEGMKSAPAINEMDIQDALVRLTKENLAIIEEDEEEEEEESDDDDFVTSSSKTVYFSPSEVAQAFSHFSYIASGRKRRVCDLQGVFDEKANVLRLSGPVIHYCSTTNRKYVHGRTDRGHKGVAMFF